MLRFSIKQLLVTNSAADGEIPNMMLNFTDKSTFHSRIIYMN